ncbi:unnamed protein product [Cyclocybe aegerita]|uniref:Uncharacterized protein n=1 Tax=Cyclocybe aegerita TaxID=1973307 RepID=A0A8S0WZI0_CYCAE|nr:unnamed protein product [Cyclocybe aegerita]
MRCPHPSGSGAPCFRCEPPASTSSAPGVCPPSFQHQLPASVSTPEIDVPSFQPEPPASISTPGISAPSFQRDLPASVSASQIGALSFQRDPPASVSASQIGAASQRDLPASIIPCFQHTPPTSTTPIPNVQDAQPPLDVQLQPPNGERIPSPADTPYTCAGSKRRHRDFVTSLEMAVKENEKAKDEAPVVHDPPKPTPDEMVRVHHQLLKISASEYSTYAAMACYVAALTRNRYEVEKASVNAVHEAQDGFAQVESKIQSWL